MKKMILLALCFCATACACPAYGAEGEKLSIVATIFPEYDWVREIADGTGAEITLLLDNGVDLHSYQPTVEDMVKIADCDLFIYVGGDSDGWVEGALKNAVNKKQVALNLLDILGSSVKNEEIVEGMEHEHHDEHEHDHDHDHVGHEHEGHEHEHEHHHHEEEEEAEADEHVWLSLRNAEGICRGIAQSLSSLDPVHRETYAANAARYVEKLSALDKAYQTAVEGAARKVFLFGDRFPFRYLADDYGLKYYAAFAGCSAESEASFETVMFLAGKVDELGLPCVMTIEGTRHKIAETVIANTRAKNQKVLSMDSMQSTTSKEVENGVSYLSVMEKNLETLKAALN